MDIKSYRTWIEISGEALRQNIYTFRGLIRKKVKLMGVIKSNAYGHGLMTVARAYAVLGVDWIGIDSIAEANKLRKEGIRQPLFVLGYTQPENLPVAAAKNISLTVSSFEGLRDVLRLKRKVKIHIKVDTGMHRQGFFVEDLPKVIRKLKKPSRVIVEGLYTHFAAAKDPNDVKDTLWQNGVFKQAVDLFHSAGMRPICHAAATGGTINFPESHFDMVRVGIGMYGLWPSKETADAQSKVQSRKSKVELHPILTWKTIISELKSLEKGVKIGYDFTETLKRPSKIAVLPIGYWHGYWRAFSSKAHVLVRGSRCKVLGRVSMDMTVVDVTGVPNVKVGDEVVLLGKQGKNEITADELAKIAGTSSYEIVTRLNPLIKKFYK